MEGHLVLAVIGYCIALSLVTETILYLIIYRTPTFQSVKTNLERHAKKAEEAKSVSSGKNLKKKQARLETWKEESAKHLYFIQLKTGFVSMVALTAGFKLLNKLFSGQVVAKLPFEPPQLLQKATQRGLTDADVTECSALFIYMLSQASLRPMISKILGWGPSKLMQDAKSTIPKKYQFDLLKQQ